MLVKTIRRHSNMIGEPYVKNPGKVYEAGDHAEMLISEGLVEKAAATATATVADPPVADPPVK